MIDAHQGMKQNKTWCLRQPNLDSKLMCFWEAIDLSRRMLWERPACLLLWQKMHTCAIEHPIEHLKHLARAPITHRIRSCVFTSSPYFSQLCTKKCPSGVTDQRVFHATFIHCLNLRISFFPKELQGYCILLYHTIWGKVLLNSFCTFFVAAWLTKDKTFMTAAQYTNCEFLVSLSFCP